MKQCDRCNALYPPRLDSCPFCRSTEKDEAPEAWIRTRRPRKQTVKLTKDPPTAEIEEDASDAVHAALEEMIIEDDTVEIAADLLKKHSEAILAAAGLVEDSVPEGLDQPGTSSFDEDRIPTAQVHYLDEEEFPEDSRDVPTPEPDDLVGEIAEQLQDGGLFDSVFDEQLEHTTSPEEGPTSEALVSEAKRSALERIEAKRGAPRDLSDSLEAIPNAVETFEDFHLGGMMDSVAEDEARESDESEEVVWSFDDDPPAARRRSLSWQTWLVRSGGVGVVGVSGWTYAVGLPSWLTIIVAAAGLVIALATTTDD